MEHVRIKIARVGNHDLPMPSYATEGSAGMDVYAAVDSQATIRPGETVLIPTGYRIELPLGFEAQIRPRSGLAIKHTIGILNAPGTIDSDYRGEIKVILTNFGKNEYVVKRGDRVAQMIVGRYARVEWDEVDELARTDRGEGGFGHTGFSSGKTNG